MDAKLAQFFETAKEEDVISEPEKISHHISDTAKALGVMADPVSDLESITHKDAERQRRQRRSDSAFGAEAYGALLNQAYKDALKTAQAEINAGPLLEQH